MGTTASKSALKSTESLKKNNKSKKSSKDKRPITTSPAPILTQAQIKQQDEEPLVIVQPPRHSSYILDHHIVFFHSSPQLSQYFSALFLTKHPETYNPQQFEINYQISASPSNSQTVYILKQYFWVTQLNKFITNYNKSLFENQNLYDSIHNHLKMKRLELQSKQEQKNTPFSFEPNPETTISPDSKSHFVIPSPKASKSSFTQAASPLSLRSSLSVHTSTGMRHTELSQKYNQNLTQALYMGDLGQKDIAQSRLQDIPSNIPSYSNKYVPLSSDSNNDYGNRLSSNLSAHGDHYEDHLFDSYRMSVNQTSHGATIRTNSATGFNSSSSFAFDSELKYTNGSFLLTSYIQQIPSSSFVLNNINVSKKKGSGSIVPTDSDCDDSDDVEFIDEDVPLTPDEIALLNAYLTTIRDDSDEDDDTQVCNRTLPHDYDPGYDYDECDTFDTFIPSPPLSVITPLLSSTFSANTTESNRNAPVTKPLEVIAGIPSHDSPQSPSKRLFVEDDEFDTDSQLAPLGHNLTLHSLRKKKETETPPHSISRVKSSSFHSSSSTNNHNNSKQLDSLFDLPQQSKKNDPFNKQETLSEEAVYPGYDRRVHTTPLNILSYIDEHEHENEAKEIEQNRQLSTRLFTPITNLFQAIELIQKDLIPLLIPIPIHSSLSTYIGHCKDAQIPVGSTVFLSPSFQQFPSTRSDNIFHQLGQVPNQFIPVFQPPQSFLQSTGDTTTYNHVNSSFLSTQSSTGTSINTFTNSPGSQSTTSFKHTSPTKMNNVSPNPQNLIMKELIPSLQDKNNNTNNTSNNTNNNFTNNTSVDQNSSYRNNNIDLDDTINTASLSISLNFKSDLHETNTPNSHCLPLTTSSPLSLSSKQCTQQNINVSITPLSTTLSRPLSSKQCPESNTNNSTLPTNSPRPLSSNTYPQLPSKLTLINTPLLSVPTASTSTSLPVSAHLNLQLHSQLNKYSNYSTNINEISEDNENNIENNIHVLNQPSVCSNYSNLVGINSFYTLQMLHEQHSLYDIVSITRNESYRHFDSNQFFSTILTRRRASILSPHISPHMSPSLGSMQSPDLLLSASQSSNPYTSFNTPHPTHLFQQANSISKLHCNTDTDTRTDIDSDDDYDTDSDTDDDFGFISSSSSSIQNFSPMTNPSKHNFALALDKQPNIPLNLSHSLLQDDCTTRHRQYSWSSTLPSLNSIEVIEEDEYTSKSIMGTSLLNSPILPILDTEPDSGDFSIFDADAVPGTISSSLIKNHLTLYTSDVQAQLQQQSFGTEIKIKKKEDDHDEEEICFVITPQHPSHGRLIYGFNQSYQEPLSATMYFVPTIPDNFTLNQNNNHNTSQPDFIGHNHRGEHHKEHCNKNGNDNDSDAPNGHFNLPIPNNNGDNTCILHPLLQTDCDYSAADLLAAQTQLSQQFNISSTFNLTPTLSPLAESGSASPIQKKSTLQDIFTSSTIYMTAYDVLDHSSVKYYYNYLKKVRNFFKLLSVTQQPYTSLPDDYRSDADNISPVHSGSDKYQSISDPSIFPQKTPINQIQPILRTFVIFVLNDATTDNFGLSFNVATLKLLEKSHQILLKIQQDAPFCTILQRSLSNVNAKQQLATVLDTYHGVLLHSTPSYNQ